MKSNNDLTLIKEINNIENAKSKYFILGFIISLIPYILILLMAHKMEVSNAFIYIILLFMIITAIINAFILSISVHHKLITFFENKYDAEYKKIKESLI